MSDNPLEIIRTACRSAEALGLKIVAKKWGVFDLGNTFVCIDGELCPLGAVVINQLSSKSRFTTVSDMLGVTLSYIDGVLHGFDGYGINIDQDHKPSYIAGHATGSQLRREFIEYER